MTTTKKKTAGAEEASAYFARTRGPLTLGGFLRAIREGEEKSLAEFATLLEVSKAHLSDVERGTRAVSVERAAAWAKRLGYHEAQMVELALQAQLDAIGLKLRVKVSPQTAKGKRASAA